METPNLAALAGGARPVDRVRFLAAAHGFIRAQVHQLEVLAAALDGPDGVEAFAASLLELHASTTPLVARLESEAQRAHLSLVV
jgi:hypothetical protein